MATVTYLFKTGGAVGNTPPTQAQLNTAYTDTTLAGLVTATNGIQKWIAPGNGKYTIIARGAAGGKGTGATENDMLGGLGAIITGSFKLKSGDKLAILVGQKGTDSIIGTGDGVTAGGGGMSAVAKVIGNESILTFNGSSTWAALDTPITSNYKPTSKMVLSAKIKFNGAQYCSAIYYGMPGTGINGFGIGLQNSTWRIVYKNNTLTGGSWTTNTWYYIRATITTSSVKLEVSTDGIVYSTVITGATGVAFASITNPAFWIGRGTWNSAIADYFNGTIQSLDISVDDLYTHSYREASSTQWYPINQEESVPFNFNGNIVVTQVGTYEPLIIAGAGNGGGDQQYSGIPGANALLTEGTNEAYKTTSFSGGGFSYANSDSTCGIAFVNGGAASQYVYNRSGRSSQAGFGGGGGNTDDGAGGGGGGYRGGVRGSNAGSSFNAGEEPHAILNTVRTGGSVDIIQTIIYKKLVLNNTDGNYYYYDGTNWVSVGNTATGAEFEDYGMEQIEFATLSYFTDYKIYAYTGYADDTKISTLITHKPLVQSAARIVSIDFTNKILTSGHLTATSEARVLVSVNDDKTWQTYNNGWQEVDVSDLSLAFADAMSATAFNAVHKNSWAVLDITELRLMFLVDTDDIENAIKVSGLTFSYIQKEV